MLLSGFAIAAKCQITLPGLNQPGSVETGSNYEFATSPSMAVLNGEMYIAYGSNDGNNYLRIIGSTDGVNWSTPQTGPTIQLAPGTAPSIASWNGYIWLAYIPVQPLDSSALFLLYFTDPLTEYYPEAASLVTETGSPYYPNSSPTLAVFGSELWIASVDNYSGTATRVESFSTTDGTTFLGEGFCGDDPSGDMPQVGAAVGMATFDHQLWFGYQTQGGAGGHTLRICSTTAVNGSTPTYYSPSTPQVGGGVNAVASNGGYVAFAYEEYGSHDLGLTATQTGASFTTGSYSGIEINGNQEINPSATIFDNLFYLAYTPNNSGHDMYWTRN
jgi:hypothetical protein